VVTAVIIPAIVVAVRVVAATVARLSLSITGADHRARFAVALPAVTAATDQALHPALRTEEEPSALGVVGARYGEGV